MKIAFEAFSSHSFRMCIKEHGLGLAIFFIRLSHLKLIKNINYVTLENYFLELTELMDMIR